MKPLDEALKRLERRVRLIRGWKFMSWSIFAGSSLALLGVLSNIMRWTSFSEVTLAIAAVTIGLIGGIIGLALPVSKEALASSIDRRGNLKDRVLTAILPETGSTYFEGKTREDAEETLQAVSGRKLYPVRVYPTHWGTAACLILASSALFVDRKEILLTQAQKNVRADQRIAATEIRKVAQPLLEPSSASPENAKAQKMLAGELSKFRDDLAQNRLTEAEALKRAESLKSQADSLMSQQLKTSGEQAQTAQTALNNYLKDQVDAVDLKDSNVNLVDGENTADALSEAVDDRLGAIQDLLQDLNQADPPIQLPKLELNNKEAELDRIEQQLQGANLSPEAKKAIQEAINKARNAKTTEELSQAINELKEALKSGKPANTDPKISKALANAFPTSMEELKQAIEQANLTPEEQQKLLEIANQAQNAKSPAEFTQSINDLKRALNSATIKHPEDAIDQFAAKMEKGEKLTPQELAQAKKALEKVAERLTPETAANLGKALDNPTNSENLKNQLKKASEELKQVKSEEEQELGAMMQELAKAAEGLNPGQRKSAEKVIETLRNQTANLDNLTPEERAALKEAMKQLKNSINEFKNSKEIQEAISEIRNSKEFTELREMMQKLQAQSQQNEQTGQRPELTAENVKEMQKNVEGLAQLIKDPQRRKELLEALKASLQGASGASDASGAGLSLAQLFGLSSAASSDQERPTGNPLTPLKNPVPGQGKTQNKAVRGQRQDQGTERVIQLKGPARIGDRAKTPYQQALPQAQKQAESAIKRQQVPKGRKQSVRDYFNALERGNK